MRINLQVLDYQIKGKDENQVIVNLLKRTDQGEIKMTPNKKTGVLEEAVFFIGYFGNLKMALNAIQKDYMFRDDPKKKEITTLKEYREELEWITSEIDKQLDLGETFR